MQGAALALGQVAEQVEPQMALGAPALALAGVEAAAVVLDDESGDAVGRAPPVTVTCSAPAWAATLRSASRAPR